jgi:histidinol dehydrogenase
VSIRLRFRGSVDRLNPGDRALLFERASSHDAETRARTAEILARVRGGGDAALFALARELDGIELSCLKVPRERWKRSLDALDPSLREAMERAARNIATAHRVFLPKTLEVETEPGVIVGRRPDPLDRVGIYAPAGLAPYPSSVLMAAVPARVAGVREIIVCSPPQTAEGPSALVLAAAEIAGVNRVFAIGGAGGVAAMAYGTASVPRVDRIVGPGNVYVAEAKAQVAGQVSIDSPAGPSELLVIADDSADPEAVARELLAQAEHDPRACAIAVVIDETIAQRIESALARQLDSQPRAEIIAASLASRGGILRAASLEEATAFANDYAPEHLLLAVADPEAVFAAVRHAGAVFLGRTSSVTFGDYLTGANHVLPTGGAARSYSGLSTLDFFRWTSYQRVSEEGAARLADPTDTLATAEGLDAHAQAARAHRKRNVFSEATSARESRP